MTGPLMWSIVAMRNSLVFHDGDKITTLMMHASPALSAWCALLCALFLPRIGCACRALAVHAPLLRMHACPALAAWCARPALVGTLQAAQLRGWPGEGVAW